MKKRWFILLLVFFLLLLLLRGLFLFFHREKPNPVSTTTPAFFPEKLRSLNEIKMTVRQEAVTLDETVINKALIAYKYASDQGIENNQFLTIIDYSRPSNEKRLWVFDILHNKLLFNTYVSHGIKSGERLSHYFSNKFNSKSSSLGVYNTERTYHGRHGLSLKLYGLDPGFNDNASSRAIVMHGAWYVTEAFIKKYGRAGRSWGCPAIPDDLVSSIVNTIKFGSLLFVYYPNTHWFLRSPFLNNGHFLKNKKASFQEDEKSAAQDTNNADEGIVFVDTKNTNHQDETRPVVAVTADHYQKFFNKVPPITRMLRRQINNEEYIALTSDELKNSSLLEAISFVIPVVKLNRGYYETELKIISLGRLREVRFDAGGLQRNSDGCCLAYFDGSPTVRLRTVHKFVRWVGL